MASVLKRLVPLLAALVGAILVCLLAYRYDNKYTGYDLQPIGGLLMLDGAGADPGVVRHLIWEWEYYPGVLLQPADFDADAPAPEQYVFIGQYSNLSAGRPQRDMHGQASYRLGIMLPAGRQSYALRMSDIYCAYKLYVNGELLLQMGEPDPASYRSVMGERVIAFEAEGMVDILIAVSSYGYITGGITHPPAFGGAQAIQQLHTSALVVRVMACAVALLLCLMFLYIRAMARYRMGLLYSLLCLCFFGYACVPLARAVLPLGVLPSGTVYLGGYYAMFLLILLLQAALYRFRPAVRRAMALAGGAVCLMAVGLSLLPTPTQWQVRLFSAVSEAYKWGMLAVMLACALWAAAKGVRFAAPVLFAVGFFGFSLGMDRLLPMHEPIRLGWFAEIAGFVVLCVLGGVLWSDMVRAMRENATYEEALNQADKRLLMLREHYRALDSQTAASRAHHHDFRQQIIVMQDYARREDWPALQAFLTEYSQSAPAGERLHYTGNDTVNIITRYYSGICREEDISFEARYDIPSRLSVPDPDLNVILGNLLENAVEACRRMSRESRQYIRVAGSVNNHVLVLTVQNSYAGRLRARAGGFATQKPEGGQGLSSVRTAAERNNGTAVFTAVPGEFTARVVMANQVGSGLS